MTKIEHQLYRQLHLYRRSGGKKNRKNQARKMMLLIGDIEKAEIRRGTPITDLRQLGKKHMFGFWKRNERLSQTARRDYYYAACYVWREILGRPTNPPHSDSAHCGKAWTAS